MSLSNRDISMYDETFVEKTRAARMIEIGCESAEDYGELLVQDGLEHDLFCKSLLVNYSAFFRNPLTFAVLETLIFPSLIRKALDENRRELRIWSAGCSCGQEPYSIAILIEELLENSAANLDYRIFATDSNQVPIDNAIEGRFSEETLMNVGLKRLKRWFKPHKNNFLINPKLSRRIEFSVFDLFNNSLGCPPSSIFGGFDMVFCCNVLYYYKAHPRKLILDKLSNCLGRGSYFVSGETERGYIIENGFQEQFAQSAIFAKA